MSKYLLLFCAVGALFSASVWAAKKPANIVTDTSALSWSQVMPGVSRASAQGDPDRGPSHFFLKYAAGLKTPVHHHSPDHYVTLISGNLTLTVDGTEHKLAPGSFFALTNKAAHSAVCAEGADCVMSIDSRGKWDVVPEKH